MLLIVFYGLFLFIQCVFLITVYITFSRYRQPSEVPEDLPVTVVICAQNEENNLHRIIPWVCGQTYSSYEVVIVDDRSADESRNVIKSYQEQYPHLRLAKVDHLPENMNGKKYALSIGIKAAVHPWILLTDADCYSGSADWIRHMAAGFADGKEFVLGFSMFPKENGWINDLIRFETVWTAMHFLGLAMAGKPYMGTGRNLGYTKDIFLRNKGFKGYYNITGGDDDLFVNKHATATNTVVVLGEPATTWSDPKRSWSTYFTQKIRHISAGRHYRPASRILLGVLSLSHIFGYIFMGVILFQPGSWVFAIGGYVVRTLLMLITFKKACQKLEIPFSTGKVIPMDLLFVILYPVLGITAVFRKDIRWK